MSAPCSSKTLRRAMPLPPGLRVNSTSGMSLLKRQSVFMWDCRRWQCMPPCWPARCRAACRQCAKLILPMILRTQGLAARPRTSAALEAASSLRLILWSGSGGVRLWPVWSALGPCPALPSCRVLPPVLPGALRACACQPCAVGLCRQVRPVCVPGAGCPSGPGPPGG